MQRKKPANMEGEFSVHGRCSFQASAFVPPAVQAVYFIWACDDDISSHLLSLQVVPAVAIPPVQSCSVVRACVHKAGPVGWNTQGPILPNLL